MIERRTVPRRVVRILAGTITAALSYALAQAWIFFNDGFGAGDELGFLFWCMPLAVLLAATWPWLDTAATGWRGHARRAAGGALAGFLWTWSLAAVLGGMIRLFSFPVLWIWTLATATGVAVAGALPHPTPVREPTKRQAVLRFAGFALAALSLAAVVWFGSVIGSVYLWDRGEGEVHILPDGFEGPVLILYDQPDGLPARYDDDGRRLFEIPRSGVMRTRMEPNDGWVSYAMYYRTTDGSLAPIHFAGNPCDDRPILQVCLMGLEMRSSVPNPPEYLAYVVARGDEIETAWASGDALVDSLVFRPYEPTVPAEPARHLTTQTEKKDAAQ